jgi:hypothetical protein
VAVGLLALCVVVSALAPASHPEHRASRSSPNTTTSPPTSGRREPLGNQVSSGELARARATELVEEDADHRELKMFRCDSIPWSGRGP